MEEEHPKMDEEVIQSPRLLAQDGVNWYFRQSRTNASHVSNVQNHLRPVVVAMTLVLQRDDRSTEWKDFLENKLVTPKSCQPEAGEISGSYFLDSRSRARLEAFLKSISSAVPSETKSSKSSSTAPSGTNRATTTSLSLMDGLAGFSTPPKSPVLTSINGASSRLLRSISSGAGSTTSSRSAPPPQIRADDLMIRLELYLRTIMRSQKLGNPCVLSAEPARALNARVHGLVHAFCNTVGTVRQQGPVLTRLLTYQTQELLAVDTLSETCQQAIRRLVMDYEHQTSFASLAFLSTPEDAADQKLLPLVAKYVLSLKQNWENLVQECEWEGLLRKVLDPDMRRLFKNVEFSSIGHLLETCAHYRPLLEKIELPPNTQPTDEEADVKQALRDLKRERITVNGQLLPPVTSRKELVSLLSQILNSTTLTGRKPKGHHRRRSKKKYAASTRYLDSHGVETSEADDADVSESGSGSDSSSGQRRTFHFSTIDVLTKRFLLAASRTGTAGDAYIVVRDLFGGEEVQVVSSQHFPGRATMEIWVHLAHITIQCRANFDVYPLSLDQHFDVEPLIQLHTTTTENISLREVRAADAQVEEGRGHADGSTTFVLQERATPKSHWRTLSIRPALYEKITSFSTPS